MKLVGRIPVEPLDDERLTNIERRIVANAGNRLGAPSGARRPYLGFAAATFAAAAAGVVGWKLHRDPPAPLADAAAIAMRTDREKSTLDIGDATIESSPNTTFGITRPDGGVLVAMTRGRIELEVAKRAGRAPLVVRAGDTEVIVVGTHFIVDCGESCGGGVDVRVTEGVVRVVRNKQDTRVAAGNVWRSATGLIAMADLPGREGTGPDGVGPDGVGPDGAEPDGATIADGSAGSGAIEIEVGKPPDLRNHVAAVPDSRVATSGSNAPRATGSNAFAGGPEVTRRVRTIDSSSDPKIDLKTLIRQEPVAAPFDVKTTDPASAVAKYRELLLAAVTAKDGNRHIADESIAYYGIAYTQHIKLGRSADALATTQTYLRRFSDNKRPPPEYNAVLWLRVRIACLDPVRGIDAGCRQAATDYIRLATRPSAIAQRIAEP